MLLTTHHPSECSPSEFSSFGIYLDFYAFLRKENFIHMEDIVERNKDARRNEYGVHEGLFELVSIH